MYPTLSSEIKRARLQPDNSTFYISSGDDKSSIILSDSAAEILCLCNGRNNVSDITNTLSEKYQDDYDTIQKMVMNFFVDAIATGHITLEKEAHTKPIELPISGSVDFWIPDFVSLELTNRCHLKCMHCYLDAGQGEDMPMDQFITIFNELKQFSVTRIQLTGGEPLLHPKFFEIMDMLVSSDVPITVSTSGAFRNESLLKELKKYNPTGVNFQISLDGMEDYHNAFRGVDGCFGDTVAFIKVLAESGFIVVVGLTLHNQTKEEVKKACSLCKELGVRTMRLGVISQKGRASENIEENPNRMVFARELLKELQSEFASPTFSITFADDGVTLDAGMTSNCGYGHRILHITHDGNIFPCVSSDFYMGNTNDSTITETLQKMSLLFEAITQPSKALCAECPHDTICKNCIAEALHYCTRSTGCTWYAENKITLDSIKQVTLYNTGEC